MILESLIGLKIITIRKTDNSTFILFSDKKTLMQIVEISDYYLFITYEYVKQTAKDIIIHNDSKRWKVIMEDLEYYPEIGENKK